MNRKRTIESGNFQVGAGTNLKFFYDNIFFFQKYEPNNARESHIFHKNLIKDTKALCLVHMHRKFTMKWGIFQVGAWTNLKFLIKKIVFQKDVSYKASGESDIAFKR